MPGLPLEGSLDYALVRLRYSPGNLTTLTAAAAVAAARGGALFVHANVGSSRPPMPAGVNCSWFAAAAPGDRVEPRFLDCPFSDLINTLTQTKAKVVLKIDERCGREAARQLASTGHFVYVLAHDSRPKNVIRYMRDAALGQRVFYAFLSLTGPPDRFGGLFVYCESDKYWYIAPATQLGRFVLSAWLSNYPGIEGFVGDAPWGLPGGEPLKAVIRTCFDSRVDFSVFQ